MKRTGQIKKIGLFDWGKVCGWYDCNAWYLKESPKEKIVWKERKKVPQRYIDFMNGKPLKVKINIKDWKFTYGSCG